MQLIGGIEHRIDAPLFLETFLGETNCQAKCRAVFSLGDTDITNARTQLLRILQIFTLSFDTKQCLTLLKIPAFYICIHGSCVLKLPQII